MRLSVLRRVALEFRYGIRLRVIFHETDVTEECAEADDDEDWWEHPIIRNGHWTRERARLHGPVRFVAKQGPAGSWGLWLWRIMGRPAERSKS